MGVLLIFGLLCSRNNKVSHCLKNEEHLDLIVAGILYLSEHSNKNNDSFLL